MIQIGAVSIPAMTYPVERLFIVSVIRGKKCTAFLLKQGFNFVKRILPAYTNSPISLNIQFIYSEEKTKDFFCLYVSAIAISNASA